MVKLLYSKEKDSWEQLDKGSREGMYMDGYLFNSFDNAKNVMSKKDLDLVICVSGYPGNGKSTLITQVASFCDPTFSEKRMYQTTKAFVEGLKNADMNTAHCLDESYDGLNSSQIRTAIGRTVMNIMNIIRQKRLYIFIALPDFFDLSKNIAIFRSRWLLHCYEKEFGDIGYFAAFDRESKKMLYIKGKKEENYNAQKASFYGSFTKAIPPNVNWKKYIEMKDAGLQGVFVQQKEETYSKKHRDKLIVLLYNEYNVDTKFLSEYLDMNRRSIQGIISNYKKSKTD